MTGNKDKSSKITIKVRLSDEDYQDITIDWSDKSCEHKQQIFFRKIASFIGLPVQYIRHVHLYHTNTFVQMPSNIESNFTSIPSVPSIMHNTFIRHLNDGDRFFVRFILGFIDHENLFDLSVDLFSAEREDLHSTECSRFYCQIRNTRAWLDKAKEIILNSEIFPKIRAGFPEERWGGDGDNWHKSLVHFNIRQYIHACCYRVLFNNTKHVRLYLPHRG